MWVVHEILEVTSRWNESEVSTHKIPILFNIQKATNIIVTVTIWHYHLFSNMPRKFCNTETMET